MNDNIIDNNSWKDKWKNLSLELDKLLDNKKEALEYLINYFNISLNVALIGDNDDIEEYSLNDYVISKEDFEMLEKAGVPTSAMVAIENRRNTINDTAKKQYHCSYNAQILNDEKKFCIQFETKDYEFFKLVEKFIQERKY